MRQDICLLLESTIEIKHKNFVNRNDTQDRLNDYKTALLKWLTQQKSFNRIIFIDNSGYPLDEFKSIAKAHPDKEVEFLSYRQEYKPGQGKSYGELTTMECAIDHSRIIAECEYVAQVTGRYFVKNIDSIMRAIPEEFDFISNFKKNLCVMPTAFTLFRKSAFKNEVLKLAKSFVYDKKKRYIEEGYAKGVLSAIVKGYWWYPFPEEPMLEGFSAETNKSYRHRRLGWLRRTLISRLYYSLYQTSYGKNVIHVRKARARLGKHFGEPKTNLLDYRFDKYTQTGNDGITEFIFKTLGIKNGVFVEIGAWDGMHLSNCRKLFEEGWSGAFIEPKPERFGELRNNYKDNKEILCINAYVETREGIFTRLKSYLRRLRHIFQTPHKKFVPRILFDDMVDRYLGGKKIDFCVIDIDGRDLELFKTFRRHLPTVICIEGGHMLPPYHKEVPAHIAAKDIQQSLSVMTDTFRKKGYKILCSYQDTYYIRKEFYNKFDVPADLTELYFDGFYSLPSNLPHIQKKVINAGLKNPIVDEILARTNYERYDYENRKIWAEEQKDLIQKTINELRGVEKV